MEAFSSQLAEALKFMSDALNAKDLNAFSRAAADAESKGDVEDAVIAFQWAEAAVAFGFPSSQKTWSLVFEPDVRERDGIKRRDLEKRIPENSD